MKNKIIENRDKKFKIFIICIQMTIFLSTLTIANSAGVEVFNKKLYSLYIENNMKSWDKVIVQMINKYKQNGDFELLYNITLTMYGYIGYCLGNDMEDQAKEYVDKGLENIEIMLKSNPLWAEAMALKAAYYGFKVSLFPFRSMYYGPKSLEAISFAREMYPSSAQVILESANVKYYTPPMFGGSKSEAIEYYKKAIDLMEITKNTENNWVYLSTLTLLAMAYEDLKMNKEAKDIYRKTLAFEPGYILVKEVLYPEVLNNKK